MSGNTIGFRYTKVFVESECLNLQGHAFLSCHTPEDQDNSAQRFSSGMPSCRKVLEGHDFSHTHKTPRVVALAAKVCLSGAPS